MKTTIPLLTCAVAAAMSAQAALNIPSDGSDGALIITNDTVIDLSRAVTATWDANNTANAGKGIYDPAKWAVVFKYSSVLVQGGATVSFQNHASRAPVVWLVSGDVIINGTVSLNGQNGSPSPWLAEPGPGGFRGGSAYYANGAAMSSGFGPGGSGYYNGHGPGASYGSVGTYGQPTYGNPSLLPLVGGSGAEGGYGDSNVPRASGGGAGAGAILIASAGTLSVSGVIRANGGAGAGDWYWGGGGSGGGIRLVADSLSGSGLVQALGGGSGAYLGGLGRIRVERVANVNSLQITPDPSVVNLPSGATPQIWLPTNGPSVKIVSVGGSPAPADPRAEFGAIGADTVLPRVASTTVIVETTNVEQASVVTVRATPRSNASFSEATATPILPVISEDPLVIRWTANVPVNDGFSAIQVKVVRP